MTYKVTRKERFPDGTELTATVNGLLLCMDAKGTAVFGFNGIKEVLEITNVEKIELVE